MKLLLLFTVIFSLDLLVVEPADEGSFSAATNALYRCGIRKRFGRPLVHQGRNAEAGQWPWHVALYHGDSYKCGGTLIDQRHVLTAAHCVTRKTKTRHAVMKPERIKIHLGMNRLDENPDLVQVKNVSEIFVYPEFSSNRGDIALLVLSSVVQFSELVIPICIVGSRAVQAEDLVDRRGWVVGWGITETRNLSTGLKTAQMPVVNNTECVQNDPGLFGRFISPKIFCASDRNGTSVCQGDSGGGMYLLAGDRWELRGITSFSGVTETGECDVRRYVVFTKVSSYFDWIKQLMGEAVSKEDIVPKRISELKCQEYGKIARKRNNGVCLNARSPHTVAIIDRNQRHVSSGSIISERFVLTKAPSLYEMYELDVEWDDLRVRVGNQPDRKVLLEITSPWYNSKTLEHHVMLLEVDTPFVFTSGLLPACLANEATENLYDTLLLNGYTGQNVRFLESNGDAISGNDFYESVDSEMISNERCSRMTSDLVSSAELCTSFSSETPFSWAGIVGGPLQTVNTRSCMFTMVGVTKLLILPDETRRSNRYTNVYSRVTAYLDWIEAVVWGNETAPVDSGVEGTGEAPTEEAEDEREEVQQTTARRVQLNEFSTIKPLSIDPGR